MALLIVAVVCAGIVGVIGNAFLGPKARARRLLERGGGEIVEGAVVTLTGIVRAHDDERLTAPFSGRPCLAYAAHAIFYESDDGLSGAVTETLSEVQLAPFLLETTDKGLVPIEGATADVGIEPYPLMADPARERAFFARHERNLDAVRTTGFTEAIVPAGARVRVQGIALLDPDPNARGERDYRAAIPRRLRLVAGSDRPLTITAAR